MTMLTHCKLGLSSAAGVHRINIKEVCFEFLGMVDCLVCEGPAPKCGFLSLLGSFALKQNQSVFLHADASLQH